MAEFVKARIGALNALATVNGSVKKYIQLTSEIRWRCTAVSASTIATRRTAMIKWLMWKCTICCGDGQRINFPNRAGVQKLISQCCRARTTTDQSQYIHRTTKPFVFSASSHWSQSICVRCGYSLSATHLTRRERRWTKAHVKRVENRKVSKQSAWKIEGKHFAKFVWSQGTCLKVLIAINNGILSG